MEETEIFLRLAFMGMAMIMTVLTVASWHRAREQKLLLAAAGFGTLAAEGLLLALGIFFDSAEALNTTVMLVGLNFLALVLLYLSVLKR
ncbi:MAG: hypothetical protein R6W91_04575 [Thermoplasmata archaeon]